MSKHENVVPPLNFAGKKPEKAAPKTEAYDELQKKTVDVLIDTLKYIASSVAIVIAIYARILQEYLDGDLLLRGTSAKLLLIAPLILWLFVILGTIIGIFPRTYQARTDLEKELIIKKINRIKTKWLVTVLCLFLVGFIIFIYIICAQIWQVFPFLSS